MVDVVHPSCSQVGPVSYHPYCGIVAEDEKEQIKQNVKGENKVYQSILNVLHVDLVMKLIVLHSGYDILLV